MKYLNGREAKLGDPVLGRTKSGQPVAGNVLQLDQENGQVQVSPAIQSASWVKASECIMVEDAYAKPAPAPAAPEGQTDKDKTPADQGS